MTENKYEIQSDPKNVNGTPGRLHNARTWNCHIRRFLAIFLPAVLEQSTKVSAIVTNHKFSASGKILKEEGWKSVYQVEEEKDGKEQIIPDFEKGESGSHKPKIEEKDTKPPNPSFPQK